MSCSANPTSSPEAPKLDDPIVQYIVLRRDLWADQGWPLGPLIAQACHASVAALWLNREDEVAQAYVAPDSLDHMHKVRISGDASFPQQLHPACSSSLLVVQGNR